MDDGLGPLSTGTNTRRIGAMNMNKGGNGDLLIDLAGAVRSFEAREQLKQRHGKSCKPAKIPPRELILIVGDKGRFVDMYV
jgi:hypothetical protein